MTVKYVVAAALMSLLTACPGTGISEPEVVPKASETTVDGERLFVIREQLCRTDRMRLSCSPVLLIGPSRYSMPMACYPLKDEVTRGRRYAVGAAGGGIAEARQIKGIPENRMLALHASSLDCVGKRQPPGWFAARSLTRRADPAPDDELMRQHVRECDLYIKSPEWCARDEPLTVSTSGGRMRRLIWRSDYVRDVNANLVRGGSLAWRSDPFETVLRWSKSEIPFWWRGCGIGPPGVPRTYCRGGLDRESSGSPTAIVLHRQQHMSGSGRSAATRFELTRFTLQHLGGGEAWWITAVANTERNDTREEATAAWRNCCARVILDEITALR